VRSACMAGEKRPMMLSPAWASAWIRCTKRIKPAALDQKLIPWGQFAGSHLTSGSLTCCICYNPLRDNWFSMPVVINDYCGLPLKRCTPAAR